MKTNYEAHLDRIHNLRLATQDRFLGRIERLENKAETMIGELASGKFYAFPVGGRYFESVNKYEVVNYLIKNKWVR